MKIIKNETITEVLKEFNCNLKLMKTLKYEPDCFIYFLITRAEGTILYRLLVKIVPETKDYQMSEEIPYPKGKPMYLIEDVDDKNLLKEIIIKTKEGLVNRER